MARKLKDKAVAKAVKGPVKVKRKRGRVAQADLYSAADLARFAAKGPAGIDWYLVDFVLAITQPGNVGEWYASRFATLYSHPTFHMHDADLIVGRVLRTLRPDITFSAGRRKVCHAIARWALFAHARWWQREMDDASKRNAIQSKCRAWASISADQVATEAVTNPLFVLRFTARAEAGLVPVKQKPAKTRLVS